LRTIVLDAGALIAAERNDRYLASIVAVAEREGATMLVPATVVAEVWRNPPGHGIARMLGTVDGVDPVDFSRAKDIGALMGSSRVTQIADASVAILAVRSQPSIVLTSDPADIEFLLMSLGVRARRGRKGPRDAAVVVEPV
jgi:hypothetical protein